MASATETALQALHALLQAVAAVPGSPLAAPLRNEDLMTRLEEGADDLRRLLNLWDGSQTERDEFLGADTIVDGYEITHEAKLEWIVCGGESSAREAAYDAGLIAVCDALKNDRMLGGAVDFVELGNLEGPGSGLASDGIPQTKGVILPIRLTFRSSRPF